MCVREKESESDIERDENVEYQRGMSKVNESREHVDWCWLLFEGFRSNVSIGKLLSCLYTLSDQINGDLGRVVSRGSLLSNHSAPELDLIWNESWVCDYEMTRSVAAMFADGSNSDTNISCYLSSAYFSFFASGCSLIVFCIFLFSFLWLRF